MSMINDKAKEFGADLAGVASVNDLERSPSHKITEKMPEFDGVGTRSAEDRKRGVVKWPEGARSAIVIAAEHPPEKPELDWWVTAGGSAGNTPGNRLLMKTVSKLVAWLGKEQGIQCFELPYHIEHGGVYMKDAAVLAGLGCIGKNNLLITPQYGPRLRLRVMLTDADLPSTGIIDFDPCEYCPVFCRTGCPQDAFSVQVYSANEYGLKTLPGRSGVYNRLRCNQQMIFNEFDSERTKTDDQEKAKIQIKYCRECELACPVGSDQST